jgi:hypothetical protein
MGIGFCFFSSVHGICTIAVFFLHEEMNTGIVFFS